MDRDGPGDNLILLPGVAPPEPEVEPGGDDGPPGPPPPERLAATVEAVLFASGAPLTLRRLCDALGGADPADVEAVLRALARDYAARGAGIRLDRVAEGWQLRTVADAAPWVARAAGVRPLRLSRPALETLAIVAYSQPVTRARIEAIRGVDSGGMLRSLAERGLVRTLGRADEPGRPFLYGTTTAFLELFGLADLADLPTLADLRELQADDPREGPVPVEP